MVHLKDDGVFDAPVDKVWRFLQSEEGHEHKSIKSSKVLERSQQGMTIEAERVNPDGSTRMETIKFTFDPPKGFTMEWLSGLMKGSKHKHTYTPMGNKTKVEVEGEYYAQGMDDKAVRSVALAFLSEVFDEDTAQLKNFK
jgi:ligand-binding SRPBCC domain-containing protein